MFQYFKNNGLHYLYISLRGISNKLLMKIRHYISGNTEYFSKQFMDCVYAYTAKLICPKPINKNNRLILILPFLNKISEKLDVSSILSSKILKDTVPQHFSYKDTPLVAFRYGRTIGQTIFNYNKILNDLSKNDLKLASCDCATNHEYSEFIYHYHGHVHTGNLEYCKK